MHSRNQPPHRHNAAVAGIAVDDDREVHALRDPAGDGHALGHGRHADVRQPGIGADHAAGADEGHLGPGQLHDPRVRGRRRMHDRQDAVRAVDELLQTGRGLAVSHQASLLPGCRVDNRISYPSAGCGVRERPRWYRKAIT